MCYTTAMEKNAFLFLACVAMLTAGAGEFSLAVRGAPAAYTIVMPADASPSQKYAAEELRDYTEKMTGVKLPIATDAAPLPAKDGTPPSRLFNTGNRKRKRAIRL